MPEGAIVEARPVDIMAAPISTQEECRVVLRVGSKVMVLMARELFSTTEGSFLPEVHKNMKEWPGGNQLTYAIDQPRRGNDFELTRMIPSTLLVTGDKGVAGGAYTVLPDKTIQMLMVYVNQEAARQPEDCLKTAGSILATLAPGGKHLDLNPRTQMFPLFSKTQSLTIELPAGWIATFQPGPDFLVYHVLHVRPYGHGGQTMGIYVGMNPGYQHSQEGQNCEVNQVPGELLGQQTTWFEWKRKGDAGTGYCAAEAISQVSSSDHCLIHAFMYAKDDSGLEQLRSVTSTLKVRGMMYTAVRKYWFPGVAVIVLIMVAIAGVRVYRHRRRKHDAPKPCEK